MTIPRYKPVYGVVVAAAAAAICGLIFIESGAESPWMNFAGGITTELAGVVFVIVVVENAFSRARVFENAQSLAREVLHDMDHAVWVWLGGERFFDIHELIALIKSINEKDTLSCYTETLFQEIGNKASLLLSTREKMFDTIPQAKEGLVALSGLSRMRFSEEVMSNAAIKDALLSCAENIDAALGLRKETPCPSMGKTKKNSSRWFQQWRLHGEKNNSLEKWDDTMIPVEPGEALPIRRYWRFFYWLLPKIRLTTRS